MTSSYIGRWWCMFYSSFTISSGLCIWIYAFAFRYFDIPNWKYVSLANFFEALGRSFQVWVQLLPIIVEFPVLYRRKHEHRVDWRLGTTVGIPSEEPVTWMELDSWCNVSTARSPRCYESELASVGFSEVINSFPAEWAGMLVGGVGTAPCFRTKPEMRKTKFPKG